MRLLSSAERASLRGAEGEERTPQPLQVVSSDAFLPPQQSVKQKEVGARLQALADEVAPKLNLSRRRFFQTSAGMAAAFVAMNETYGFLFAAGRVEAATPTITPR